MTTEELKIWVLNKLNGCYKVKHSDYPESTYYFYDEQFQRQKKLSRIVGEELVYPIELIGRCLFEHCKKSNIFFFDSEIWLVIDTNLPSTYLSYLSNKSVKIQLFIKEILNDIDIYEDTMFLKTNNLDNKRFNDEKIRIIL